MGKKEKYILVRVTEKERNILKRKAKKVGLTVSDFVRSSLIHSDNLTINVIDTSVLSKTLFELHKHGVNLNQLMKFCNTYGLDAFNESHVIPTLENERTVFLQTKAALLSLEEEARRGNVMVNLELRSSILRLPSSRTADMGNRPHGRLHIPTSTSRPTRRFPRAVGYRDPARVGSPRCRACA